MKARLLNLLVDLLLDCFFLLIGPDKSPGITVSTIPELAAALMRDSGVDYPRRPENQRHGPLRAVRAASSHDSVVVCVSTDGPSASSRVRSELMHTGSYGQEQ
jgi:hypothetical protein